MSMPAVSRHLKVLEHAGLITRGREAQWRPCRITAAPLKDVSDWVGRYRRGWGGGVYRVAGYFYGVGGKREKKRERRNEARKRERGGGETGLCCGEGGWGG